jgi:hypothetical protein
MHRMTNLEAEKGLVMKAANILSAILTAGLAAAFLGGAAWGHNADIDSDRYLISNDVITAVGAFGGALFLALTARFFYLGVRAR